MTFFHRLDPSTAASYRALITCTLGTLAGLGVVYLLRDIATMGYVPYGAFLLTIFTFLLGDWAFNGRSRCYDPGKTFLTYTSTLSVSSLIIYFFFYSADAGPFADQIFAVPNILANIAFGLTVPALLGAVYGLTFNSAFQSFAPIPRLRIFALLAALFLPLLALIQLEYLMVLWIETAF